MYTRCRVKCPQTCHILITLELNTRTFRSSSQSAKFISRKQIPRTARKKDVLNLLKTAIQKCSSSHKPCRRDTLLQLTQVCENHIGSYNTHSTHNKFVSWPTIWCISYNYENYWADPSGRAVFG